MINNVVFNNDTHPLPERKEMVYFYYCKATEWGRGGEREEIEQVETKIQTDKILDKFKIMEERWGRSGRNESGGGAETIRDGETRGNRQSCAAVISKAGKKPTELKRWWGWRWRSQRGRDWNRQEMLEKERMTWHKFTEQPQKMKQSRLHYCYMCSIWLIWLRTFSVHSNKSSCLLGLSSDL